MHVGQIDAEKKPKTCTITGSNIEWCQVEWAHVKKSHEVLRIFEPSGPDTYWISKADYLKLKKPGPIMNILKWVWRHLFWWYYLPKALKKRWNLNNKGGE